MSRKNSRIRLLLLLRSMSIHLVWRGNREGYGCFFCPSPSWGLFSMTQINIPIPRDNLVSESKQKSIAVFFCQNSSLSPPEYHNSVSRVEASGRGWQDSTQRITIGKNLRKTRWEWLIALAFDPASGPWLMDRPWPFDFFCRGTCAIKVRQSYPSNPCLGQFCDHIRSIESKRETINQCQRIGKPFMQSGRLPSKKRFRW